MLRRCAALVANKQPCLKGFFSQYDIWECPAVARCDMSTAGLGVSLGLAVCLQAAASSELPNKAVLFSAGYCETMEMSGLPPRMQASDSAGVRKET
jgi:hypothetical protein